MYKTFINVLHVNTWPVVYEWACMCVCGVWGVGLIIFNSLPCLGWKCISVGNKRICSADTGEAGQPRPIPSRSSTEDEKETRLPYHDVPRVRAGEGVFRHQLLVSWFEACRSGDGFGFGGSTRTSWQLRPPPQSGQSSPRPVSPSWASSVRTHRS